MTRRTYRANVYYVVYYEIDNRGITLIILRY